MSCTSCEVNLFDAVELFRRKNSAALQCFREHGVIPRSVDCPTCNFPCTFRESTGTFRCRKSIRQRRQRPTECGFTVSVNSNTFLERSKLPPWKVLLYVSHFLSGFSSHDCLIDHLDICRKTSVDWRSFCSEVCIHWVEYHQNQIGGPEIEVEIDETVLVRRKYNRGRVVKTIWLFGGIERETKKNFLIPLTTECGENERRDASTLIPLIIRHIRQGSIIYSDSWGAYNSLANIGYTHFKINHSENFVDPQNPSVHTQNIERLWGIVKRRVVRPGIRPRFLKQYLARFQFMRAIENRRKRLHAFLLAASSLYPGPG